jgi:hypothetical protein
MLKVPNLFCEIRSRLAKKAVLPASGPGHGTIPTGVKR